MGTSFINPKVVIYMGKDKFENEDLIKYHFSDEDIWFHVADLSSAHVYLRIPGGVEKYSDIEPDLIEEMCQLVKANSIEGGKKAACGINYTWARNLKKTIGMEVGAVNFYHGDQVKRV